MKLSDLFAKAVEFDERDAHRLAPTHARVRELIEAADLALDDIPCNLKSFKGLKLQLSKLRTTLETK